MWPRRSDGRHGRGLIGAMPSYRLGVARLVLGVTEGETPARRLYEGAGFHVCGDLEPLRPGSALRSQKMLLELTSREPESSGIPRGETMAETVTVALLKDFLEAFNRHDLDSIMEHFADDCVFYMPRGATARGDRYSGKTEVRAGLAKRFEGIPDVHYGHDRHWACGDFGVSEWTLTGTTVAGRRIEVRGVDLLEFENGKIVRKDSFWKIVE
jgi:ketosteroid isomerase-like protein